MNELHLFSGAGGGILGGLLLGHTPVCAVEIEPYCRKVLLQRQRDGILPWFPIWDDVRTFDGKPWRGVADVVCGGFPCQDISSAGKGAGIDGDRSGLWREMVRVVCEVEPKFVFVENSSMLTVRGLGTVLGNLADLGYDAEWGVLGPEHFGGTHQRSRIWILAYPMQIRFQEQISDEQISFQFDAISNSLAPVSSETELFDGRIWHRESEIWGVVDGVADWSHRLKAIGNGQVPAVAAKAWHVLCQRAAAGTLRKRPAQHTTAAVCNTAGH